ncbi:MAG: hypothetical protein ACRC1K_09185 [Planctomycetia bacterium]
MAQAATSSAEAADDKQAVISAYEKPVLFKVKNVTIDAVDADARTIAASFGAAGAQIKLAGLPLVKDVHILRWYQSPSIANNLPFTMDRLKELVGKEVSMLLLAEKSGLAVYSMATAND